MQNTKNFFANYAAVQEELDAVAASDDPEKVTELLRMMVHGACEIVHYKTTWGVPLWFMVTQERAYMICKGRTYVNGLFYPVELGSLTDLLSDIDNHVPYERTKYLNIVQKLGKNFERKYPVEYDEEMLSTQPYDIVSRIELYCVPAEGSDIPSVYRELGDISGEYSIDFIKDISKWFISQGVKQLMDIPPHGPIAAGVLRNEGVNLFFDDLIKMCSDGFSVALYCDTETRCTDYVKVGLYQDLLSAYFVTEPLGVRAKITYQDYDETR